MKLSNFAIIIICFLTTTLHALEVISTAGSQGETTSGSLNWTLGEAVTETITNETNTLTQGFQQSKLTVTAINDLEVPGIELSVYPNPTNNFLSIEVKTDKQIDLLLSLIDLNGKLLLQKKMTGNTQTVNMQNYSPATYILKVTEDNIEIRTYQIVKH